MRRELLGTILLSGTGHSQLLADQPSHGIFINNPTAAPVAAQCPLSAPGWHCRLQAGSSCAQGTGIWLRFADNVFRNQRGQITMYKRRDLGFLGFCVLVLALNRRYVKSRCAEMHFLNNLFQKAGFH